MTTLPRAFLTAAIGLLLAGLVSLPVFAAGQQDTAESITVYSAGPGGLASSIAEGFEAETGITVNLYQATTGAVLGRLEAESANPAADVVVLASWPAGLDLVNRGWTAEYPGAALADRLHEGWNHQDQLFGYSASALGITFNTDLIDSLDGIDWSDLADEQYADQIAIPDPAQSGSALDFLVGYVGDYGDDAWAVLQALADNGIQMAGPNRPALDSVITGANSLVLAGVDYMAYGAIAGGEPVDIVYAASGTVVNPRPAMITSWTQNEAAARQFIDYMLSDAAQQMVADVYIIPGRSDFPAHPDRVEYADIKVFDLDWDWMTANQQQINDRFQEIMR